VQRPLSNHPSESLEALIHSHTLRLDEHLALILPFDKGKSITIVAILPANDPPLSDLLEDRKRRDTIMSEDLRG
jgi:hypothetical protein